MRFWVRSHRSTMLMKKTKLIGEEGMANSSGVSFFRSGSVFSFVAAVVRLEPMDVDAEIEWVADDCRDDGNRCWCLPCCQQHYHC
ncbi:hypothetical protein ACLOJK_030487 [Asimina triloba]